MEKKLTVSRKKAKKLTVSRKKAKILTVNRKSHYPIETLKIFQRTDLVNKSTGIRNSLRDLTLCNKKTSFL